MALTGGDHRPAFGLGQRAHAMHELCLGVDHKTRPVCRVEDRKPIDATRYCFRMVEAAEAFHREFGGEIISL